MSSDSLASIGPTGLILLGGRSTTSDDIDAARAHLLRADPRLRSTITSLSRMSAVAPRFEPSTLAANCLWRTGTCFCAGLALRSSSRTAVWGRRQGDRRRGAGRTLAGHVRCRDEFFDSTTRTPRDPRGNASLSYARIAVLRDGAGRSRRKLAGLSLGGDRSPTSSPATRRSIPRRAMDARARRATMSRFVCQPSEANPQLANDAGTRSERRATGTCSLSIYAEKRHDRRLPTAGWGLVGRDTVGRLTSAILADLVEDAHLPVSDHWRERGNVGISTGQRVSGHPARRGPLGDPRTSRSGSPTADGTLTSFSRRSYEPDDLGLSTIARFSRELSRPGRGPSGAQCGSWRAA
jgi:hypothetical protein